jgi:hypothetical protein
MPELQQRHPGVSYKLDGESDEADTMLSSLFWGFGVSLFGIYALLAIPLKSYLQPLIIMGVIPFGIIGAFAGHMIVGIPFDMFSFAPAKGRGRIPWVPIGRDGGQMLKRPVLLRELTEVRSPFYD